MSDVRAASHSALAGELQGKATSTRVACGSVILLRLSSGRLVMKNSVGRHYYRIAPEYSLFYVLTFKMYISVLPRIMNSPIYEKFGRVPRLSPLY